MRMVIPLTSNLSANRFPFTLRIDPSPTNGLSMPSIALVFQLCAADVTHLGNIKGQLERHYIEKINEMMRQMLGL